MYDCNQVYYIKMLDSLSKDKIKEKYFSNIQIDNCFGSRFELSDTEKWVSISKILNLSQMSGERENIDVFCLVALV